MDVNDGTTPVPDPDNNETVPIEPIDVQVQRDIVTFLLNRSAFGFLFTALHPGRIFLGRKRTQILLRIRNIFANFGSLFYSNKFTCLDFSGSNSGVVCGGRW